MRRQRDLDVVWVILVMLIIALLLQFVNTSLTHALTNTNSTPASITATPSPQAAATATTTGPIPSPTLQGTAVEHLASSCNLLNSRELASPLVTAEVIHPVLQEGQVNQLAFSNESLSAQNVSAIGDDAFYENGRLTFKKGARHDDCRLAHRHVQPDCDAGGETGVERNRAAKNDRHSFGFERQFSPELLRGMTAAQVQSRGDAQLLRALELLTSSTK